MRIAIIADPLDNQRAGVHVYLRELVNALVEHGGQHEYILIREQVDEELPLRQIALRNIHLPIGYASFRLFVLLPILLRRLKVDAVFEPAHFGPFNLPAKVKRITMIHDLTPLLFPHFHRYHSQLLQRLFLPGILRRANLVLSNSHNTTKDLANRFPFTRPKTATIHLGINTRFCPQESRDFLATYDIKQPYFLYVGTIEPRKNLGLLLTAYQQFRAQSDVACQLVIVGQKGWKSADFYAQLEEHPNRSDIILPGFISSQHLVEAYSHARALVYPSQYEGFGFPVLEAMACGTNVICPANSSLTEVGGELAYYYATEDVEGLCEQLQLLAKAGVEVERRAAAGPAWAAGFNWPNYAQQFETELAQLLEA